MMQWEAAAQTLHFAIAGNCHSLQTTHDLLRLIMADHGDAAQQVGIYHPKDAIGNAMQSVFIVGGFGLAISTVQSALTRQNVGMMSVFTKTGGTAAAFGMIVTA